MGRLLIGLLLGAVAGFVCRPALERSSFDDLCGKITGNGVTFVIGQDANLKHLNVCDWRNSRPLWRERWVVHRSRSQRDAASLQRKISDVIEAHVATTEAK